MKSPILAKWGFELASPRSQLGTKPLGSPGSPPTTAGIDKEGPTRFRYRTPGEGLRAADPKQSWASLRRWDFVAKLWVWDKASVTPLSSTLPIGWLRWLPLSGLWCVPSSDASLSPCTVWGAGPRSPGWRVAAGFGIAVLSRGELATGSGIEPRCPGSLTAVQTHPPDSLPELGLGEDPGILAPQAVPWPGLGRVHLTY